MTSQAQNAVFYVECNAVRRSQQLNGALLKDRVIESIIGTPVEFGFGRIQAGVFHKLVRVRRERIAKAANRNATMFATEGGDRLGPAAREECRPDCSSGGIATSASRKTADKQKQHASSGPDVAVTFAFRALFVLVFEAAGEFLVNRRERSGVAA